MTVLSVPTVVERPTPSVLSLFWLSTLMKNFRKSIASGGASLPTAMPLPPPTPSVGAPRRR